MPITVESLRRRIEKLRKAESDALATANANAGGIALCQELIRELEACEIDPNDQRLPPGVTSTFGRSCTKPCR